MDKNLNNMVSADGQARRRALDTRRTMMILVSVGVLLGVVFIGVVGPAILRPIESLTRSVREFQKGNLDLVVTARSRDEIGQLATAFNEMASSLREFRRSDRARLLRTQRATQLALDTFPDAVAICNTAGEVEMANTAAQRLFGLKPESTVAAAGHEKVYELYTRVLRDMRPICPEGYDSAIQIFRSGEERFFLLIHTYEPHVPYTRGEFAQWLDPGRVGPVFTLARVEALRAGRIELSPEEVEYVTALYDGDIASADGHVGLLLDTLDELGLDERVAVIVTSDHGEDLGARYPRNRFDHGHALLPASRTPSPISTTRGAAEAP